MRAPTGALPTTVRRFGEPQAAVVAGDHWVEVPLDHREPSRGRLRLYAREVRRADLVDADLPYLLFLQGGPGCRSPLPGAEAPSWLGWALDRYRVLLLDQRGTGRSTTQDRHTLARLGRQGPRGVPDVAEHLALFRADAIVEDAEHLRHHLLGDAPWTLLGQSFGGFCTWTYLSRHPAGVAAAIVTGGIPPVGASADEVYRATFAAVEARTAVLDRAHPPVRIVLADVADHLAQHEEYLPTGERLTVARLQEVGHVLGTTGGIDRLAHLADDAWSVPGERLSEPFLAGVAGIVSYAAHPLYALIHEACYAERGAVTAWSAQRVRGRLGLPEAPVTGADGVPRLPLTGETVFPHTVDRDPVLAPLADVAHALAARAWHEPLYDAGVLARNDVPVAARVYRQDMYVDPSLSLATAGVTGAVRVVVDEVHHHDGLRRAGTHLLDELVALLPEPAVAR